MKNYVQAGEMMTVAAPADTQSGDLVVVGALIGVAAYDALSGEPVEIQTSGVLTLPKASADDVGVGDLLYWNSANSELTKTPGTDSKPLVGLAAKAAGGGVTVVDCRLMLAGQTGPAA
jgi:predicted RecA/RadA family phage recombinase